MTAIHATEPTDSLAVDSIQPSAVSRQPVDSIQPSAVSREKKESELKSPVHYQASDSMIMMGNGTAFLHGKGDLKYESMQLQADYIRIKMDSSTIYAHGVYDSIYEEWHGKPVFNDGKESYETNEITYNIKTQKGYIRHVVTQ